jgi:VWFA-related protein
MNLSRYACAGLILCLPPIVLAQQSSTPAETDAASQAAPSHIPPTTAPGDPVLTRRLDSKPPSRRSMVTPEGRIKLDIMVTDAAGKPAFGLDPWDFKLLDDNQPRKILSFRSFHGVAARPNPPVEVILLLDTVNTELDQVAIAREQIKKFLRQNGGRLARPVSIMVLNGTGLRIQARPSTDGNAQAEALDHVKVSVHTITSAMGDDGAVERFQLSVRTLALIAENERKKPGRKVLLWIGSGWPLLSREDLVYSARNHVLNLDSIVSLSTSLREARIALYSLGGGQEFFYQPFLKGVTAETQADPPNLALPVLAVESGGRSVAVGNAAEMAAQLDRCIAEASAFYTLSFEPPHAKHADEYHELKVQVARPGLEVRTNTGYYNQP